MFDRRVPFVTVAEDERGARGGVLAVERPDDGADEGRFTAAELADEADGVARADRSREFRGDPIEREAIARFVRADAHREETLRQIAKRFAMVWRANDVMAGAVTGIFSAAGASLFEGFFLTNRFLSLGELGGALAGKITVIVIAGALLGGVVGLLIGAVLTPRPQTR